MKRLDEIDQALSKIGQKSRNLAETADNIEIKEECFARNTMLLKIDGNDVVRTPI